VTHRDDGKSHLARPRVHDVTDAVAVSSGFLERLPQLRHLGVAELKLVDVALTQTQRTATSRHVEMVAKLLKLITKSLQGS